MFNAQNRIRQLMAERGWTIYRLAQESGLSQTTISNIFKRNNQPSLPTVNAICDACGITLAQFFTENDTANSPNAKNELDNSSSQGGSARGACCIHQDNSIVHNRSAILCGSQQRLPELHWTVSVFFYKSKGAYSWATKSCRKPPRLLNAVHFIVE